MNIYRLLSFFFLASAMMISSCTDDPDPVDPPEPPVTTPLIDISGFTFTDEQGQITTSEDNDDWALDDIWPDEVKQLFASEPAFCSLDNSYSVAAYPNPSTSGFQIAVNKPEDASFDIRFVDEFLNVIQEQDGINFSGISFANVSGEPDTLRIYYLIHTPVGCAYRGHGDIIIE